MEILHVLNVPAPPAHQQQLVYHVKRDSISVEAHALTVMLSMRAVSSAQMVTFALHVLLLSELAVEPAPSALLDVPPATLLTVSVVT